MTQYSTFQADSILDTKEAKKGQLYYVNLSIIINLNFFLVISRFAIRNQRFILAYISCTKFEIRMRLQKALKVSLSFHSCPKRYLVKLIVRYPDNYPSLLLKHSILQHRVSKSSFAIGHEMARAVYFNPYKVVSYIMQDFTTCREMINLESVEASATINNNHH